MKKENSPIIEDTAAHPLYDYDGHINCASGKKFNLVNPTPEMIDIHDIARGLSFNSHFGGQTPEFFSIAQHSLLVVDLMPDRFHSKPKLMMAALLHDAHEAYYGDMLKPLKMLLPDFEKLEKKGQAAVFKKWDLPLEYLSTIKPYDKKAQEIEYATFYKKSNILQYWSPRDSMGLFMNRYWHFYNGMKTDTIDNEFPPF